MNTYLPHIKIVAATTVNTGAGGLSIFPTLLMQNGESVYNSELNATNLASPVSVKTFKFWTDFYTRYKLNPDANFYQRFRVGTIPLGIAPYTQYLTFAVAAPEIEGKWAVYELPGVKKADGTIDRSAAGSGTGCAIMKSSKDKESAWEFLKSLDALVDGPFILEQRDLTLKFRGSKNQRLLHLEHGTGKILSIE